MSEHIRAAMQFAVRSIVGPTNETETAWLEGQIDRACAEYILFWENPIQPPMNILEMADWCATERAKIDAYNPRSSEEYGLRRVEIELRRLAVQGAPGWEPVAWRWRAPGAANWIYDPDPDWMGRHKDEIEIEPLYAALPQGAPAQPLDDGVLLDWLEEQVVSEIYLDDGRLIDVRGNSVRAAVTAALSSGKPGVEVVDSTARGGEV